MGARAVSVASVVSLSLNAALGCSSADPLLVGAAGTHSSSTSSSSGSGGASGSGASGTSNGSHSSSGVSSSSGSTSGSGNSSSSSSSSSSGSSSGSSEADGGSDESAWLVPMNAARSAVGDSALTWDPIAAQVALGWANQCNFSHNPDAGSQYDALGGTGGLGENVAAGAPTEAISDSVASWVNEEQYYDHATNTCASGQTCGHYTQIVWKNTTAAGCATVICATGSPFGSGQWQNSVCDFSPPGNYVGESPY